MLLLMSERVHLHHVDPWVPDLEVAERSWGWLLCELGYELYQSWARGRSWKLESRYIVIEQSPDQRSGPHDRRAAGLNHLAFHAGTPTDVDRIVVKGLRHGWTLLFADRHPHAGGPDHYAAYLENTEGFEVELCAASPG